MASTTTMKIEKLTPEQEARFPEFVDKWLKIGLCTDPANRPEAERGINLAYELAGLKKPTTIVWFASPLSMAITHGLLKNESVGTSVGTSVRDSVRASVGTSVRDRVRTSVGTSVRESVRTSVRDRVRASVWESVRASVWESVWESVENSVRASVRDSVRDSIWESFYGQHNSGFLSFYNYFYEVVGLEDQTRKLAGLNIIANSAGWLLPCENICFVSERHNVCKVDDRGLIHCEDGPAIQYPDGFSVYGWHGVRVPEEWIVKKSLDAKSAITWDNLEQRRAACEIVGWAKILRELNAKTIQKSENPFVGELVEVDLPDIGREKYLRVMCGTDREFALPVPPNIQRASEAQAWLNVPDENWQQYESMFENVTVRT